LESLKIIKLARNASRILKGNAKYKILNGNTPILPTTTHINTKPVNQEKSGLRQ
jgi:hypothetical protein